MSAPTVNASGPQAYAHPKRKSKPKRPTDLFKGASGTLRPGVKSTPALRKQGRKRVARIAANKALDDPSALTAPLTPRTLKAETDAAIRLRYGPQERAYAGELRVSDAMHPRLDNWYAQAQRDIDAAKASSAAGYAQAQQTIQGNAAVSSQTDATNRQQLIEQMAKDAASRGATLGPQTGETGVQAESNRRRLSDLQAGTAATLGANQGAYLDTRKATTAESGVQAHTEESARARGIRSLIAALKGQEGDYRVAYGATARQNERNAEIARATLGINASKAQSAAKIASQGASETKRHHKATETTAEKNARLSAGRFRSAQEKDAYQRSHGLGPYKTGKSGRGGSGGGPTHAAKVAGQKAYSRAQAQLALLGGGTHPTERNPKYGNLVPVTQEQFVAKQTASGIDSALALAAWQMRVYGGVGPKTQKTVFKRYRMKLPGFAKRGLPQGSSARPD